MAGYKGGYLCIHLFLPTPGYSCHLLRSYQDFILFRFGSVPSQVSTGSVNVRKEPEVVATVDGIHSYRRVGQGIISGYNYTILFYTALCIPDGGGVNHTYCIRQGSWQYLTIKTPCYGISIWWCWWKRDLEVYDNPAYLVKKAVLKVGSNRRYGCCIGIMTTFSVVKSKLVGTSYIYLRRCLICRDIHYAGPDHAMLS